MLAYTLDDWCTDGRFLRAGEAAIGCLTMLHSWSGKELTNGFVPREVARRLGTAGALRKLVDVGLAQLTVGTVEHGPENAGIDGYLSTVFRSPKDHMAEREQKAATSASRRAAGAKGGTVAAANRRAAIEQQTDQPGYSTTGSKHPVLLQQTSSPAAPPHSLVPYPFSSTSEDHHHQQPPDPSVVAVVEPDIDMRLSSLVELAAQIAYQRVAQTDPAAIGHPAAWKASVRNRLLRTHGPAWLDAIHSRDYDPAALIAAEADVPITEIRTALRRIRRHEEPLTA